MLPVNIGGHSAYQDTFVSDFLKFYPDPFVLPMSTWDYIVQFWYLDLSMTDSIMQECYSIFGPGPKLLSYMLRSYLLALKLKVTSITLWCRMLRELLLDSAHDAYAVYEYCRQENITPFIDLNPGHTGHFTYKDDFTINEDGFPIYKMGLRMPKDGYEAAKTPYKIPVLKSKPETEICL